MRADLRADLRAFQNSEEQPQQLERAISLARTCRRFTPHSCRRLGSTDNSTLTREVGSRWASLWALGKTRGQKLRMSHAFSLPLVVSELTRKALPIHRPKLVLMHPCHASYSAFLTVFLHWNRYTSKLRHCGVVCSLRASELTHFFLGRSMSGCQVNIFSKKKQASVSVLCYVPICLFRRSDEPRFQCGELHPGKE